MAEKLRNKYMPTRMNNGQQSGHWVAHILINSGWISVLVRLKKIPVISDVKFYILLYTPPSNTTEWSVQIFWD